MIQNWRDEWRCASTMSGVQCVMTPGTAEMPVWSADSWVCPLLVSSYYHCSYSIGSVFERCYLQSVTYLQMLMLEEEHSLAEEGVPYIWMTFAAGEQSFGLLTAHTVELVYKTVFTLKMLE